MELTIKHIAIIGKGMIGISLAVLFTGNGYRTTVFAKDADIGRTRYNAYYSDLISQGLLTEQQAQRCSALLGFTQEYGDLAEVDLIFECVAENLPVKQSVYAALEKHCRKYRAIASATSAFSPEELAEKSKAKDKILVAHPFNPPHLVPCFELVKGVDTAEETVENMAAFLSGIGREVAILRKSVPGFICNRLQHALYREAVYLVEQGICGPGDIDKALRGSFIPRYTSIGLFEHFDYAGLDLVASIEDYLFPTLCNAEKTQNYIACRIKNGELGFKTGRGVYDWRYLDADEFRRRASRPYFQFFNWNLPEQGAVL